MVGTHAMIRMRRQRGHRRCAIDARAKHAGLRRHRDMGESNAQDADPGDEAAMRAGHEVIGDVTGIVTPAPLGGLD